MTIFNEIGKGIAAAGIFIAGLFGYSVPAEAPQPVGADTVYQAGLQTYTLAGTGVSSSATSFTLTSFTLPQNGKLIQDNELSDTFYITLEPGSRARQEFISCTTVAQNSDGTASISGCTRGLSPVTPYTASTSLQFAHAGGTSVIFSNPPQIYEQYPAKANDETITGQWTFSTFPITPSNSIASTTAAGIAELATGDEAASSTLSGDIATSKLVLHTGIATSSAPSSGNVVVVTGDDGNIDQGFISSIGLVNFTATTTGTLGSTTLRIYTSATSTWTKPAFLKHITIWVCGAGGSGGNGTAGSESGGGGGGGGCGYEVLDYSELASTSTVGINVATTTGMSSSFGTYCSATSGSSGSATNRGGGGSASGCDLNFSGAGGSGGINQSTGDYGGAPGGSSVLGPGGGGGSMPSGSGDAGSGYGGGGGGGAGSNASGFGNGGSGAQGVVIVTEYF